MGGVPELLVSVRGAASGAVASFAGALPGVVLSVAVMTVLSIGGSLVLAGSSGAAVPPVSDVAGAVVSVAGAPVVVGVAACLVVVAAVGAGAVGALGLVVSALG